MKTKMMKRATTVVMALAVAVTFSFGMMTSDVQAASKPNKVTGIKATRTTSSVTLTWKKAKRAKGYRIYKKTNGKYKRIKTTKSRKYTVKKLKSGKAYYFKVRAYRKVNGKTYWGKLSSTKTVVTKTIVKPNDTNSGGTNTTAPTTTVIGGQTIKVGGTYDIEPMKDVNLTGGAEKPVLTGVKVTSIDLNNGVTYGTTKEGLKVGISKNAILVGKGRTDDYRHYSTIANFGGSAYYTQSNNENTKIYWTCNGKEPTTNQVDETGSCAYTTHTKASGYTYEQTTQLRGTTCNTSFTAFDDNRTLTSPNIFWVKVYKDGKYIGEKYIAYNVQ